MPLCQRISRTTSIAQTRKLGHYKAVAGSAIAAFDRFSKNEDRKKLEEGLSKGLFGGGARIMANGSYGKYYRKFALYQK